MPSIRMESVWMVLGESAGVAAAMAVTAKVPLQQVPYSALKKKLVTLSQRLVRSV